MTDHNTTVPNRAARARIWTLTPLRDICEPSLIRVSLGVARYRGVRRKHRLRAGDRCLRRPEQGRWICLSQAREFLTRARGDRYEFGMRTREDEKGE